MHDQEWLATTLSTWVKDLQSIYRTLQHEIVTDNNIFVPVDLYSFLAGCQSKS